ncbi:hypothetical protein [Micrococcus terreus]|uniref:hypothetical protein n=1 Tax=Micrococcus terreus TaxID=574650 RepID=UPI00254F8E4B|nr:hypothetical protein [Micrococcus terreus]MDK7702338.1 hypothetical protein [Micrococcus terreus]WOO97821.1 hypothetical protein R3I42_01165 [Micrococcus terreus]
MKRGLAAGAAAITITAMLTGCGEGEPQTAATETVTATATATETVSAASETEEAATPSPSTETGYAFTPAVSDSGQAETVYFMARWLPDDEVTTTPVEGVVSILVNGTPMKVDLEASLPARPAGIDYYMEGFTLDSGTDVGMRVTVLDDALSGSLECTISVEGDSEPLVREMSTDFQDTGVPMATCDAKLP